MKNKYYISSFSAIHQNKVWLNNQVVYSSESVAFNEFSKAIYKNLNINYLKFFKMDNLCKLAVLNAELLLKEQETTNIAVLLSNYSSSLDTDIEHQKMIEDEHNFYPSPAVFVYTLANICVGEISIKHHLKSENAFFISKDFDTDFMLNYAFDLLESNKSEKALIGWVDYFQKEYKSFLFLIEKQGQIIANKENINNYLKLIEK